MDLIGKFKNWKDNEEGFINNCNELLLYLFIRFTESTNDYPEYILKINEIRNTVKLPNIGKELVYLEQQGFISFPDKNDVNCIYINYDLANEYLTELYYDN